MIATDFAPNESWHDALLSLRLLLTPWLWKKGNDLNEVKKRIENLFIQHKAHFFLTGRSALFHLLQSLELSANAEVIVQAFTCEAVILPIIANKLKPVYVDIETQTFSLNPVELETKITDRTKVVILQHTFGLTPAHRTKIQTIVRKHDLVLIEDIAHGYNPKIISNFNPPAGRSIFLMSFGRSKALSSVFGGAIVTNIPAIQKKLAKIEQSLSYPSFGFIMQLLLYKPLSMIIKSSYDFYLGKLIHKLVCMLGLLSLEITQKEKGGEYDQLLDKAYPNALSSLLIPQLNQYEQKVKHRALICSLYQKNLKSAHFVTDYMLRYSVLVDDPQKLITKAVRKNIFLGSWYNQVVAPKSLDLKKVQYQQGSCPVAEKTCIHIVNLPLNISRSEALKVIDLLS